MTNLKIKHFSLTIVLMTFFVTSFIGQIFFGFYAFNEEQLHRHLPQILLLDYFTTGHFISSVFENMESEFLQMSLYVFLTVGLYQKGSAESKKPPEEKNAKDLAEDDEELRYTMKKRKIFPLLWRLYENSLTISLATLFIISFFFHSWGSYKQVNHHNLIDHQSQITFSEIFKEPEFWFESFQNWQSEFFSIAVLCVFSIFLRQKDSSQSKKMMDSTWKTGSG